MLNVFFFIINFKYSFQLNLVKLTIVMRILNFIKKKEKRIKIINKNINLCLLKPIILYNQQYDFLFLVYDYIFTTKQDLEG